MRALYDSKSKTIDDRGMKSLLAQPARIQSWLDVEAALAQAQAGHGMIPASAAVNITANCHVDKIDLTEMERLLREIGHGFVPVIKVLVKACDSESGKYVHYGVTTQNIQQTAQLYLAKQFDTIMQGFVDDILRNLAKMASDFEKPNKVHTLFPEEVPAKMWPLPIGELFMAGRSSVETMKKLEIYTIGDLANTDPAILELHLKSHGRKLWEFANGLDDSEVESVRAEAKGVGNSTTLPKDLITEAEALPVLKDLAVSVGQRLRKAGQKAGMVSVEIKYHTFNQVSHQKQMERQTNQDQDIYQASIELFRELWSGEPIRLLGIRTSKLSEESEPEQLSLFDMKFESEETRKKKKNLKEALKKLEGKYGDGIVKKGW